MRDTKIGVVDSIATIHQQIQVERPRAPASAVPDAPLGALDFLQAFE